MSNRLLNTLFVFVVLSGFLVGCGSATPRNLGINQVARTDEDSASGLASALTKSEENPATSGAAALLPTTLPSQSGNGPLPDVGNPPLDTFQLIIKQGQIRLLVKDTDVAIDRLMQVAADAGGYIISNRVWFENVRGENYKYATYTIGVPVDEFENALRRLRSLAVRVVDETASGQDVTDEYIDLESRLGNLKATRDRIREFLAQAETVEEALRVNEQLSAVEAQIEQVQGRMRYLSSRAAFSTITVQLDPQIPEITPTPTATPTPTPTPAPWSPGNAFQGASGVLVTILQALVEASIWIAVVILPIAAPWIILYWIIKWIVMKKKQ